VMMTVANRSDTGHKLDWMLDCVPIRVRDIWQIAEDAIIRCAERQRNNDMMCMECDRDYVQQLSTARNTLDFCSARCELKNTFPTECDSQHTASIVVALRNSMCDLLDAHDEPQSSNCSPPHILPSISPFPPKPRGGSDCC
jgi:hypothetical protein